MKLKRVAAAASAVVMLFVLTALPALGEEIPEGFSSMEEYYNYLVYGEMPSQSDTDIGDMKVVGENSAVKMYYDEKGADVYIEDKSSGKIYGSQVDSDYLDTSSLSPSSVTNLVTVNYADSEGNLNELNLTSDSSEGFSVSAEYSDSSVRLDIAATDIQISFSMEMTLTEDGFEVNIPFESISEEGDAKLVSLRLLPALGAAKPGEDGYIFYPDGSGALMEIYKSRKPQPEFYYYYYYCDDKTDPDTYEENKKLDIKSLMLPVYGIKHTEGGIFAEITAGDADAGLHIAADALYQSYFELFYRSYNTVDYSFNSSSKGQISKAGESLNEGDRTVKYHILSKNENTYSDMAVLYRNELVSRGELKAQTGNTGVPLSVEFFMGIGKKAIIGKSIQALTTFSEAADIMSDLAENGVSSADFMLKGWCDGGYDTLPTASSAESKLGGNSGLDSLSDKAEELGFGMYLLADLINADSDTGSFNARKNALRNAIDTTVTNTDGNMYWLNPSIYLPSAAEKLISAAENRAVCFGEAGTWLVSDVGESHATSRAQMVESIVGVLESAAEQNGTSAVTGGNKYAAVAADRLYDIPDSDSQYYQTTETVPFWQMVMHGFTDYSSLAINHSYDFTYQKLKAVETGSIPHFVITEKSPNLLQGTSFDGIFNSQYSVLKSTVLGIYEEMNERLGQVWNLTIDRHEYLSEDVVRVTYSDGSAVYINYSGETCEVNGVSVGAMDYVLVEGA